MPQSSRCSITHPDDVAEFDAVRTILVVDDEADIALTLKAYFELHGYRVLVAYDGVEALRTAREEQPDLVVTDITMPYMDGLEFVARLRQSPICRDIPVIVISAHDRRSDLPYFRKPFDPKALLAEMRRLLAD